MSNISPSVKKYNSTIINPNHCLGIACNTYVFIEFVSDIKKIFGFFYTNNFLTVAAILLNIKLFIISGKAKKYDFKFYTLFLCIDIQLL